jgi:hypothetical protein
VSDRLRDGAYSGGSRLAVPFPAGRDEDQPDEDGPDEDGPDEDGPDEDEPDEDQPDEDQPDEGGDGGGLAQDGAGWVLGILLWGWVVLPFLKGGPGQVKRTLMAKFLNKAADGSPLP